MENGISKIKIISDGTGMGTQVLLDGKPLVCIITKVEWCISAVPGIAEAKITFAKVEIEAIGDTIIQEKTK